MHSNTHLTHTPQLWFLFMPGLGSPWCAYSDEIAVEASTRASMADPWPSIQCVRRMCGSQCWPNFIHSLCTSTWMRKRAAMCSLCRSNDDEAHIRRFLAGPNKKAIVTAQQPQAHSNCPTLKSLRTPLVSQGIYIHRHASKAPMKGALSEHLANNNTA